MPSNHLILFHPLLFLPSIFPSIRVFSSKLSLHIRWPKFWSFSFSISHSNEHSGLISFRIYWFDLLAVQGTLKSLLQDHSLKASVVWCSAFFVVPLSHPYMTSGKSIAWTRWTFVGKVMSLLFNTLSRFVLGFLVTDCVVLKHSGKLSDTYPLREGSVSTSTGSLSFFFNLQGLETVLTDGIHWR